MYAFKLFFASGLQVSAPSNLRSLITSRRDVISSADVLGRLVDIMLGVLFFFLTLPILAIAAIAVKLENPATGVFFRQTRFGYHGRPFTILKLRTMIPEAEKLKSELIALSPDKGPGFKIPDDPRVTPIGRLLRRFYVDEIPQILIVLKGDMSIVGPRANSYRPETYEPWQRIRLIVKPGLTGTWQIARNKPVSFEDRCRMDLDYVTRKSVYLDISIVMNTVVMMLTRANGS